MLNRLHGLVVESFHWCSLDIGPIGRLCYGERIVLIGFVPLPEWGHRYGWNYFYPVTVSRGNTGPVMSRTTGFKRDKAWLLFGQELSEFSASEFPVRQFFIRR
jgi:hypothetical protein